VKWCSHNTNRTYIL